MSGMQAPRIVPHGPVLGTTVLWTSATGPRVSVVVKATMTIRAETNMALSSTSRPTCEGFDAVSRDTAPFLPRASVVLTGSAFAPAPFASVTARVAMLRGDHPVIDESSVVRRPRSDAPERIPLDPLHASVTDPRAGYLLGSEWIVLEGVSAHHSRLRSRLPDIRAWATVGWGAESRQVELVGDTLHIDADALRATMWWRGSFPLAEGARLDAFCIDVGVSLAERPVETLAPASGPIDATLLEPTSSPQPLGGTLLHTAPVDGSSSHPLMPFERGAPARPLSSPPRPSTRDPAEIGGTVAVSPEAEPVSLPFRKGAATSPLAALRANMARAVAPLPPAPSPPAFAPSVRAVASAPLATVEPAPFRDVAAPPYLGPAQPNVVGPLTAPSSPKRVTVSHASEVELERCAALAGHLAHGSTDRAAALRAEGLTEPSWAEVEKHWAARIGAEERDGGTTLRDAYDATFIGAWESRRTPTTAAEYARLSVAAEGTGLGAALEAAGIRRSTWTRLKRVWTARLARDKALAATFEREMAKLRRR